MPIPRSIEEAAARAEEIQRQMGTPRTETPADQKQAMQEPVTAAPEAPKPNPVQGEVTATPSQELTPEAVAAMEASWETRFKVLQGKLYAEVPRLHSEVRELKQKLDAANAELNVLKSRPAAPDMSALTPEEREQYGEEFLQVVAKVAKQNAQPAQQIDPELVDRLNRVENVVAETREEGFFRKLGEAAQNWETLNTDAGFLAWLAEEDGLSGRTRQELFNDAYHRLDVQRVAKFFNTYGGNQSSVSRADQIQPLESQVVPRPNGSAPAPPQGKQLWTHRAIANFYDEVRRGMYRGKEADMARIEQDIFAAQTEGRVR